MDIKISNNYIKEHIAPVQDYKENFVNLIKRVVKVVDGKEETEYLQRDKNGFSVKNLKRLDLIKAVRYDKLNNSAEALYYIIWNITESQLTLSQGYQTYNKAKKALDELKTDINTLKTIIEKIKDVFGVTDERLIDLSERETA